VRPRRTPAHPSRSSGGDAQVPQVGAAPSPVSLWAIGS
jgi:hypothetical protein